MKKRYGPLDRQEPRSPSFSRNIAMAVCGLAALLLLCGFKPTTGFAASILSFRAGLQPGGVRLVIDLDEPAEYTVTTDASTILLDIDAMSAAPASGRFLRNTAAEAFTSKPSEGRTFLEVRLKSPSVTVRHFTLPMPDRVVLDLFPSPRSGGSGDARPQVQALHGLIPSQPIDGQGKGYRDLRLLPEVLLLEKGLAVKTFPFHLPATKSIVGGGSFRPVLRFHGPLEQDRARVTFILNDVPLEEIVLVGAAAGEQVSDIDLPATLLRPGKNAMTLAAMTEPKNGVKDGEGSLAILDGSFLRLDYLDASDFSLGDMAAFLEGGPPFPDRGLVVVIPDEPGPEEVQAAMELLLQWNGGSPSGTAPGRVLSVGSVTPGIADSSHMIYLGRGGSFPRSVLKAFHWEPPSQETSFLSCFVNNYGKLRLLITSETAEGILGGATPLLDRGLRGSLNARRMYVSPIKALPKPGGGSRKGQVTFKDLTGGDLVLSGAGKSSRRIEIMVPPGDLAGSRTEVSLSFRSSPLIDGERSTLTLFLGGAPAASVNLGKSRIGKDQLATRIPKVLHGASFLAVEIEAYLVPFPGGEEVPGEAFWVMVDGSSHVRVPLADKRPPALLEYLPFLMGDREVTLFIGSDPGDGLLSALAAILSEWRRISGVDIKITVKPLSALRWDNLTGDAVIAGGLDELFLQGVPLAAARQGGEVVITGGKKGEPAFDVDRDAFFQLLHRKGASSVLVVSWPAEGFAEPFPGEFLRSGKLKGDACVVSSKGETTPLYIAAHKTRAGPFSSDLSGGSGGRVLLGAAALGLSLALLWVLVFLGRGRISR